MRCNWLIKTSTSADVATCFPWGALAMLVFADLAAHTHCISFPITFRRKRAHATPQTHLQGRSVRAQACDQHVATMEFPTHVSHSTFDQKLHVKWVIWYIYPIHQFREGQGVLRCAVLQLSIPAEQIYDETRWYRRGLGAPRVRGVGVVCVCVWGGWW